MNGTLYCVGVGPGDPSLLTLKAVGIINSCPVIAAPDTGRRDNTALGIVKEYVAGKRVIMCHTPMTKDKKLLSSAYNKIAADLRDVLSGGKDVCFVTLGDPSVYSTFSYIHHLVTGMGFKVVIVPGVPSFCAVAAALGVSLCEGGQPLHIIPASYGGLDMGLDLPGSKVLMKSGGQLGETVAALKKRGLASKAKMVARCTMPGEKKYENLSGDVDADEYFATIIVREDTV